MENKENADKLKEQQQREEINKDDTAHSGDVTGDLDYNNKENDETDASKGYDGNIAVDDSREVDQARASDLTD